MVAIEVVIYRTLVAAIARDGAAKVIADGIEGRAGARHEVEDPDDERRGGDMQAVIESVVTER